MNTKIVRVRDFTTLPGARHRGDGDGSADEFFEDYVLPSLNPVMKDKTGQLLIDLDGTLGYASSFVSQLAVRVKNEFESRRAVKKKIIIKSDDDRSQEERFWDAIKQN